MRTLRRRLGYEVLRLADAVLTYLTPPSSFKRLRRKIALRILMLTDGPAAAAEIARNLGVTVGDNCRFYGVNWGHEPFLIEIGSDVLLAYGVRFVNHDSGVYLFRHQHKDIVNNYGRIKIGDNCFIGINATIMPNVQIGRNCIIAAGAVVLESFPDDCVIMGNPAKVAFSTGLYKAMKLDSPLTVRNEIAFPAFDFLESEERKRVILDQIGDIPIREARGRREPNKDTEPLAPSA